jgi:multiple antibiotic resistance protein
MGNDILHLTILFFVIFDPFASFTVFTVATREMEFRQRVRTAGLAILVAATLSYGVLFFGEKIILVFGTELPDFKVAAGIILVILGIKMALGESIADVNGAAGSSSSAVAALIGTPLLTGPAAITTIIILVRDYGIPVTGISITIVLLFTSLLFLIATKIHNIINPTLVRVFSTLLGLITISWGVKFIRDALTLR